MLRSVNALQGYRLQAIDGEIGTLAALFFEEERWRVRYLVVDLGNWLFGRRVLISPEVVADIDSEDGNLFVELTKESIENSPDVSTDMPVSREQERALHAHYQWQPYWEGGMWDPWAYRAFPPALGGVLKAKGDDTPATSSHLRSTAEVSGYAVEAKDGDVGQITDFLVDDKEWAIRLLVVEADGPFAKERHVLVPPPWVRHIQWLGRRVQVNLSRASISLSPPFDETLLTVDKYEKQLLEHFQSWTNHLREQGLLDEGAIDVFLGKDIMGNPVIAVNNGRAVGKVKDIYLSSDCKEVAGIYLGTEGLFSRREFLVKSDDVVAIGEDAVLVNHPDVVYEESDVRDLMDDWIRRDEMQGRPVDTVGGTKVGRIGDVVIRPDGTVHGFSLSHVFVAGPIAENRSVAIHTVQDVGSEDGSMTINLEQAEQQELSVA